MTNSKTENSQSSLSVKVVYFLFVYDSSQFNLKYVNTTGYMYNAKYIYF